MFEVVIKFSGALFVFAVVCIACIILLDYAVQYLADMRLHEAITMMCVLMLTCIVLFMGTLDELTKVFRLKKAEECPEIEQDQNMK